MKKISRNTFYEWLGHVSVKYYWLILAIALFISALSLMYVSGVFTSPMKMNMSWLSMAPQRSQSVIQFNKITKEFGDANPIIISIKGDNTDQLKKLAKEISLAYKNLKEDIKDVFYRVDLEFIKKHGFMLQKAKDLKRSAKLFSDFNLEGFYRNLNNDFEKEYIEETEEPLAKQEKNAARSFDALKDIIFAFQAYLEDPQKAENKLNAAIDNFARGEEYFLSRDKTMILILVQPSVSLTAMDKIIPLARRSEKVLDSFRSKYRRYQFGQTGMAVVSRDEMDTGTHDTVLNLITAAIAITLLLIFSFRMIAAPFLSIMTLFLGIFLDLGLIHLAYGRLNIMTAMIGPVLIGLGIDYAIHLLTGYTQHRYRKMSQKEALIATYQKTGPGLITGALTTAIAFLVFILTDIEMMKEIGFAMGFGIICTFLVSFLVLPSSIIAKEKIQKRLKYKKLEKNISMEYPFLGNVCEKVIKRPSFIIGITIALTLISLIAIPRLHFISDFRKLEARGLLSLDLMDEISKRFDMSTDPVHIITTNLQQAYDRTDQLNKFTSVGYVDSIVNYLPPEEKQKRRIPYINEIKNSLLNQPPVRGFDKTSFIKELKRLEKNIIEIGDMAYLGGLDKIVKRSDELANIKENKKAGENIFDRLIALVTKADRDALNNMQQIFSSRLRKNLLEMCHTDKITMQDVPANIKNLTISDNGKSFLINVYASKEIWKNLFTEPFLKDVRRVAPEMTGTPVLMYDVIDYAARGGRQATILAFLAIVILLILDFRNIKFTLVSLIPLILGSIWVLGFLVFSGIYFTWMTIMIVPLIIGIGIDDGVHIIHRYRVEGEGSTPLVLKTTGKAVTLTSLTTMIAFGSLVFSKMVGYQQFGLALFTGIGILFLLSAILLPVLLSLLEKKK
ncbi:MAG: MMPL family transporter [Spirochaetes bacterium]|nr:MMPL family transporter [Spirochaetota bacterium]